jgi:large subunit ribosomal protein L10
MPKTEKIERVAELKQRIEGSGALLLADYRGLTVSEIGELRRSLSEADAKFAVIKNTLMARAATEAGMEDLASFFTGPSAVTFVSGDPVAAAKKLKAATRQFPALVLKGGYMDGQVLDADAANGLADLESREAMLSKIAGLLQGEISRAAAVLVAAQSKFLSLLEAYKEKLPAAETNETETPPAEETNQTEAPATEETNDTEAPATEEVNETETPTEEESNGGEAEDG